MADTNNLRKLASAATPGPWEAWDGHDGTYAVEYGDREVLSPFLSEADANYIAAVNPSAILSLLNEHEAALAAKDKRIAELEAGLRPFADAYHYLTGIVFPIDKDFFHHAANLIKEKRT